METEISGVENNIIIIYFGAKMNSAGETDAVWSDVREEIWKLQNESFRATIY